MIHGIFGKPWIDLSRLLDLAPLDDIHEEVCLAFAELEADYTGGSHRSMGIMPKGKEHEAFGDYGEVIARMTPAQYETFRSLADDDVDVPDSPKGHTFGEERDVPLSRRQMLWLEARFGVYFPWKRFIEMIPNDRWEDKSDAEGKAFTRTARTFFPKTIAYVEKLPFAQIGRCNVMGVSPNDHGTIHRDGVPADKPQVDHFITLCPRGDKRLYLWDEEADEKLVVEGRAYWFNDSDWHGVLPDPWLRYSIRVDGVFAPGFLEAIERSVR